MSISVITATSPQQRVESLLLVCTEQMLAQAPEGAYAQQCAAYGISLDEACKAFNFSGKAGSVCSFYAGGIPVVLAGLGLLDKAADSNMETLRRGLGSAYSVLKGFGKASVGVILPSEHSFQRTRDSFLEQVVELLFIASYEYLELKKDKKAWEPTFVLFGGSQADSTSLEVGAQIGAAMNMTRTLADTPGNHMYPEILARKAKEMADAYGLVYKEISQEEAAAMGMGCFYSVAKGSDRPGRVVILEYAPKASAGKSLKTLGFVGKGVCYDTGGISLKPSNYMQGMKYDMSGAAAVFATMRIAATLQLNARIIAVTPLVENMPSGKASKQDDVVTALNGSTVEIDNTDAEGRLILSDALCYMQREYNPDILIDIATLTGSCAAALGYFHSGLMTRDEGLRQELTSISNFVGDKLWSLPLTDEYKVGLDSSIADIINCAPAHQKAGATMAGLFLEHFIDKGRRWAHIDIAGTDSKIAGTTYLGKGATGVGVRILVEYARRFAKAE